jgi:hypothetical protein
VHTTLCIIFAYTFLCCVLRLIPTLFSFAIFLYDTFFAQCLRCITSTYRFPYCLLFPLFNMSVSFLSSFASINVASWLPLHIISSMAYLLGGSAW